MATADDPITIDDDPELLDSETETDGKVTMGRQPPTKRLYEYAEQGQLSFVGNGLGLYMHSLASVGPVPMGAIATYALGITEQMAEIGRGKVYFAATPFTTTLSLTGSKQLQAVRDKNTFLGPAIANLLYLDYEWTEQESYDWLNLLSHKKRYDLLNARGHALHLDAVVMPICFSFADVHHKDTVTMPVPACKISLCGNPAGFVHLGLIDEMARKMSVSNTTGNYWTFCLGTQTSMAEFQMLSGNALAQQLHKLCDTADAARVCFWSEVLEDHIQYHKLLATAGYFTTTPRIWATHIDKYKADLASAQDTHAARTPTQTNTFGAEEDSAVAHFQQADETIPESLSKPKQSRELKNVRDAIAAWNHVTKQTSIWKLVDLVADVDTPHIKIARFHHEDAGWKAMTEDERTAALNYVDLSVQYRQSVAEWEATRVVSEQTNAEAMVTDIGPSNPARGSGALHQPNLEVFGSDFDQELMDFADTVLNAEIQLNQQADASRVTTEEQMSDFDANTSELDAMNDLADKARP